MKRDLSRRLVSCLGALMLTIFCAGLDTAHAQNPNCCDYIINTTLVPATCFPIAISTTWSNGQNDVVVVNAPGYLSRHFPFPCPPAPTLNTVTLTSATGCVLTETHFYCGGCLFIVIA